MELPERSDSVALTLGIDLASQPKSTALCVISWGAANVEVTELVRGSDAAGAELSDEALLLRMLGSSSGVITPVKIAIDAPLGWPVDFVRGIGDLGAWPVDADGDRRRLERRATDHWIHAFTGKQPLSVTTDRIAYAAMRAAGLLGACSTRLHVAVDRSGLDGTICEAYPDPAIRAFGLWPPAVGPRQSYKGGAVDVRAQIVMRLRQLAPWLAISPSQEQDCVSSDDYLDALICALVARAVHRGLTVPPPEELRVEARNEGWIHIPRPGALQSLRD